MRTPTGTPRRLLSRAFLIAAIWIGVGVCHAADERAEVGQVVTDYLAALGRNDHRRYLSHLSGSSINFLRQTKEHAIHLSAEETVRLNPYQQYLVVLSRAQLTKAELSDDSVEAYLGRIDRFTPILPRGKKRIERVVIAGETATADVCEEALEFCANMPLVNESGTWKVRLDSGFADEVTMRFLLSSGFGLQRAILESAKKSAKGKASWSLWNPLEGPHVTVMEAEGPAQLFVGQLKDGHPFKGTLVISEGIIYRGDYEGWNPRGKGTIYRPGGVVINASFEANGEITDVEYIWPEQRRFFGELRDGVPHGPGKCVEDGRKFACEYRDGVPVVR